jgi:hypothetical protein
VESTTWIRKPVSSYIVADKKTCFLLFCSIEDVLRSAIFPFNRNFAHRIEIERDVDFDEMKPRAGRQTESTMASNIPLRMDGCYWSIGCFYPVQGQAQDVEAVAVDSSARPKCCSISHPLGDALTCWRRTLAVIMKHGLCFLFPCIINCTSWCSSA